jgi:hypothetical protein
LTEKFGGFIFCQFICIEIYLLNQKRIIMATNGILQLLGLLFLFAAGVLLTGMAMHGETGCDNTSRWRFINLRRFMTWRKWTMVHTMLRRGSVIHLGGLRERPHAGCKGHTPRAGSHAGRCSKRHYPPIGERPSALPMQARGLGTASFATIPCWQTDLGFGSVTRKTFSERLVWKWDWPFL